jgi:hypothetical protein
MFFLLKQRKTMKRSLAEAQSQRDAAIEQAKLQPKMDCFTLRPPSGELNGYQMLQEMDVGQYSELSNEAPKRELSTEEMRLAL